MSAPARYVVTAPRSSELVAWLEFNGVRPRDVPYPSEIFVETSDGVEWFIRYETYVRSEAENIVYDLATEMFECEERLTPMAYDPPMWWLRDAAPTGGVGAASVLAGDVENVPDGAFNCD